VAALFSVVEHPRRPLKLLAKTNIKQSVLDRSDPVKEEGGRKKLCLGVDNIFFIFGDGVMNPVLGPAASFTHLGGR